MNHRKNSLSHTQGAKPAAGPQPGPLPGPAAVPKPLKSPAAAAVYHPQPESRVLQTKAPVVQPSPRAAGQPPRTPVAPPVYRPQPTPKALQPKAAVPARPPAPGAAGRGPSAPPAYRPQPPPHVLQRKAAPGPAAPRDPRQQRPLPPAPAVYRPTVAVVLQPKRATAAPPAGPRPQAAPNRPAPPRAAARGANAARAASRPPAAPRVVQLMLQDNDSDNNAPLPLASIVTGADSSEITELVLSYLDLTALSNYSQVSRQTNLFARREIHDRTVRSAAASLGNANFGASPQHSTIPHEWEAVGHETYGRQLRLREGNDPFDAIRDFIRNPQAHSVDCAEFTQVVNIYANFVSRGVRPGQFTGSEFYLRQHTSTSLRTKVEYRRGNKTEKLMEYRNGKPTGVTLNVDDVLLMAPVGSRVMFRNPPALHTAFYNENTVKLGEGRYAGHPLGTNLTEADIINRLGDMNLGLWQRPHQGLLEDFDYVEPSEEEKKRKDEIFICQVEFYDYEPPAPPEPQIEVTNLSDLLGSNNLPPVNTPPRRRGNRNDCFITTACVRARGLADDCAELTTLRAFRDGYVRAVPGGPALIEEYYRVAPPIVGAVEARPDAGDVFDSLYRRIEACLSLIREGESEAALRGYVSMVEDLRETYGRPGDDGRPRHAP